jgi:DNA-binding transcriptional ArsR family regulator
MTSPTSGQNYFVDRWRKLAFKLRIKGDAKLVLLALVELYAGHKDGSNCYPSIDSLVWHTELSRRTVQRALDLLEERGIVTRIQCVGTSNLYEFGDADTLERTIPERPAPASRRHMRQADTRADLTPPLCHADTPPVSQGHPPCVTLTPYHSQGTPSLNTPNEQAAATHTREGERACEASQPAAAPKGQDLNLDHEQRQQQTANKPAVDAAHDEASPELVQMLGTLLASRMASLVRKPDAVTPAMIRPTLRTLKRWAAGDEGKVKEYLLDELDRQEGRDAHERAAHPGVLLKWLADRKSWNRWLAAAASATPATPDYSPNRDKSIPVGRPPRPGMKWNSVIGDWTNSCAIHTGLLANLPGSDADDEVTR